MKEYLKPYGIVQQIIEYDCGKVEITEFNNKVLNKGREALASCLARNFSGSEFNLFINRMIWGDGGTSGGILKKVSANRNGLFGITQVSKPVITNINPNIPSQIILTSVIPKSEGNTTLNEMALQLDSGDLYSMVTFPDFTKTNQMQITYNWRIGFL